MPDLRTDQNLLPLIEAVIEGSTCAADAGRGMTGYIQDILEIAESLGQLDRDHPCGFTPAQAGILHDLIDTAANGYLTGKSATTPKEKIAERLTDLAFEISDPMAWAIILSSIRDGHFSGRIRTAVGDQSS